jgi:hypothetical protein
MVIGGYFIDGYWWLFYWWLLLVILYIKATVVSVCLWWQTWQVRGRAGQGRVARVYPCPLDLLAARNNRLGGVYVGSAWKILPVTARSLWSWWQTGQGGQGSCCGGPREVPFLLKKSLGKTGGPASNQTKIHLKKKIIFIIEHIKRTKIFLKKKIETK